MPDQDWEAMPVTTLLVQRARRGELERFDQLCERTLPSLHGWARLRIPAAAQARVSPEDVVQETWLRALRFFGDFDERRATFRAWLFGLARNVLLEALREASDRRAMVDITRWASKLERLPDSVTSVTRRAASDEALTSFLEHVAGLGDDERQLVVLCGLEGQTHRAAGARLGLTEEATKKRWQRLRAELVERGWTRLLEPMA